MLKSTNFLHNFCTIFASNYSEKLRTPFAHCGVLTHKVGAPGLCCKINRKDPSPALIQPNIMLQSSLARRAVGPSCTHFTAPMFRPLMVPNSLSFSSPSFWLKAQNRTCCERGVQPHLNLMRSVVISKRRFSCSKWIAQEAKENKQQPTDASPKGGEILSHLKCFFCILITIVCTHLTKTFCVCLVETQDPIGEQESQQQQQQDQKEEAPAHTQPGKEDQNKESQDQVLEALINAVKQKKFKLGIYLHHYSVCVCLRSH